jgi:hypothetical protein
MSLFVWSWLPFANRAGFISFVDFFFNMIKSYSLSVQLSCFSNGCICEYRVIKRFLVLGRGGCKAGQRRVLLPGPRRKGAFRNSPIPGLISCFAVGGSFFDSCLRPSSWGEKPI